MKKILLWLLLFFWIWFINFSSAWSYTYTWYQDFIISHSTSTADWILTMSLPIPITSFIYTPIYEQFSNISCDFSIYNNPWNIVFNSLDILINKVTWWKISIINGWVLWSWLSYSFPVNLTYESAINYINIVFKYARPVSSSTSLTIWFSCTFSWDNIINQADLNYTCPECPSCSYTWYIAENDVTENYCTNKFSNLISESDITTWYCETEFWLIDPENCPASWWTGDVLWSAFWVNDRQIQGAWNIFLYLPDFLNWDYIYLNSWSTLQVDVTNEGDTQYIEDILTVQTYHPSSEDFTYSFTWTLTLLMPYIIITLFILFVWRLLRKIFK